MKIGDHAIHNSWFKYLGLIIQNNGHVKGDVNHRIGFKQSGWNG